MAGDERALVKKDAGNRRERRERDQKAKASGVDNTFRRTWDKDEYAEKAEARDKVCRSQYSLIHLATACRSPGCPAHVLLRFIGVMHVNFELMLRLAFIYAGRQSRRRRKAHWMPSAGSG